MKHQADMVKKKYELILSMLKNERLTYFNQVKKNENQIQIARVDLSWSEF